MATHKLGFLKVNTSDDGFAFRIGNGKIHRFGGGGREAPAYEGAYGEDAYDDDWRYADEAEGADEAAQSDYDARSSYPDRTASRFDGYEDAYADRDYGGHYRDARDGYSDDRYDDAYADESGAYGGDAYDGYDDRYAGPEDGYDDGDYEDRYADSDAGDYDEEADYVSENPVLRFIDEHDWVTYVLLVLLPPLGIYLLWRRRLFEQPMRLGISVVSGVWFVVALILLISSILSGTGDSTRNPPITMTTVAPMTAAPSPEVTDSQLTNEPSGGVTALDNSNTSGDSSVTDITGIAPAGTVDALAPDASPTPLPGYSAVTVEGTVLVTATGPYYHNNAQCPQLEQGVPTSNLSQDAAMQRGKTPCPVCYPGIETYYHTANGRYYHSDRNCSNMKNATPITKEAAENAGQTACPVCILKTVQSIQRNELRFADSHTTDKSGINVYATQGGTYFHTVSDCSGMTNASSIGLLQALLAGKQACPKCAASAGTQVWFTEGGKSYHNKADCSGMQGAYQSMLAEALVLGKAKCPVCWGKNTIGFTGNGVGKSSGISAGSDGTVYVYATPNGKYYHTNASCSGMTNPSRVTLTQMIQLGRQACPVCAAGAETTVYATASGKYYHSYATCSGMQNASSGTMAQAIAMGKQRCPNCWSGGTEGAGASSSVMVYATENGQYYHTNATCSGMQGATRIDLATAVRSGKKACPTCASAANRTVYSTDNGQYYHSRANCSGMTDAKKRTLEQALILGQSSCPVCIGSGSSASRNKSGSAKTVTNVQSHNLSTPKPSKSSGKIQSSKKYKAGASGVKVYASANDQYYHGYKQHAGSNAKHISIETAMNYGKKACPTCLRAARTTVYAVPGGRYYHKSKTCAGAGAVSGRLASALASGLDACPVCVTRTRKVTDSKTFKLGTSGIRVYASMSGKYFHTSKSCAGAGASRVTLEKALNYGKTPCPNCAKVAGKTVYATSTGNYYHASRAHAGAGASAGRWAVALAMGKKACPICIGGSESMEESDVKYPASADTRVYINTNSATFYYHRRARCKDANLSGGTGVTLGFAITWGFRACPFCNPPTSIK